MDLAVSNLAWDNDDDIEIFNEFKKIGILQIEGIFNKINHWSSITENDIIKYKQKLESFDIEMKSIQSIFYNSGIDNLFDEEVVLTHFLRIIKFSKLLGVTTLVFGSPNLRKKINGWETKLSSLLTILDYLLIKNNIELCIEPNAREYGGQYFFTVVEIVNFIKKNNYKNIKSMIDTHNVLLENENPIKILNEYYDYIGHIHISEKKLNPFIYSEFHLNFAKTIKEKHYNKTVTYEVLKHNDFIESLSNFILVYK